MRPASRAANCWRSSCARHIRSSLLDTDGLVEHPRTINEIATASPTEPKLMQYHTAFALWLKEKARRGEPGAGCNSAWQPSVSSSDSKRKRSSPRSSRSATSRKTPSSRWRLRIGNKPAGIGSGSETTRKTTTCRTCGAIGAVGLTHALPLKAPAANHRGFE